MFWYYYFFTYLGGLWFFLNDFWFFCEMDMRMWLWSCAHDRRFIIFVDEFDSCFLGVLLSLKYPFSILNNFIMHFLLLIHLLFLHRLLSVLRNCILKTFKLGFFLILPASRSFFFSQCFLLGNRPPFFVADMRHGRWTELWGRVGDVVDCYLGWVLQSRWELGLVHDVRGHRHNWLCVIVLLVVDKRIMTLLGGRARSVLHEFKFELSK